MLDDRDAVLRSAVKGATCALLVLGAIGGASAQMAPRSFVASPDIYREVAHTPKITAIQGEFKPGQRDKPHSNPESLTYFVTDCDLTKHRSDGTTIPFGVTRAGAILRSPADDSYWLENVGQSNCRMVSFAPN